MPFLDQTEDNVLRTVVFVVEVVEEDIVVTGAGERPQVVPVGVEVAQHEVHDDADALSVREEHVVRQVRQRGVLPEIQVRVRLPGNE